MRLNVDSKLLYKLREKKTNFLIKFLTSIRSFFFHNKGKLDCTYIAIAYFTNFFEYSHPHIFLLFVSTQLTEYLKEITMVPINPFLARIFVKPRSK